jgi:hypothetical protein
MSKPKAVKQKTTKKGAIVTGYKATDANIRCRTFQFEVGKWHKCEGDLVECGNGFHFCEQPSGVWAYYNASGTRVWKVEAKEVLETPKQPGADYKRVARYIRLVEEIKVDGYGNTGDRNTGYGNTGDGNTGDRNTGYGNTGDWNTGDRNTGDRNTGDRNTGYGNTGYGNTGDRNTGYGNTGYGNATNRSAGYFCLEEPNVICFDVDSGLNHNAFRWTHGMTVDNLLDALRFDEPIKLKPYESLPGITSEKLAELHKRHINARKASEPTPWVPAKQAQRKGITKYD